MNTDANTHRQLDLLVRQEHGQLVAWLVARLGAHRLDLAEDVAQEALLAALSNWPYKGLPDHPSAWLKTVARNRAIDRLRREGRETGLDAVGDTATEGETDNVFAARIPDPELRLVFLCCHPALTEEDRLCLTLKVVSGFTAREIANVLLKNESAIGQRLARAKRRLRALPGEWDAEPSRFGIGERSETVQKVIYLMFALGYAPRSGEALTRKDVCFEALRLAREIARHELTSGPSASALLALLAFQSSRLDARETPDGQPVLLRDQDRTSWRRDLIDEAVGALSEAQSGALGRYHLEAGIASLHATATSWEATDWQAMGRLYAALEQLTGSPVVTLNACVAQAMAGEAGAAFQRLETLADESRFQSYVPYHVARAEILIQLERPESAARSFEQALACDASEPISVFLEQRLASCL